MPIAPPLGPPPAPAAEQVAPAPTPSPPPKKSSGLLSCATVAFLAFSCWILFTRIPSVQANVPVVVPTSTPTVVPTSTFIVEDWSVPVTPAPFPPISDPAWSQRPALVNGSAWDTIKDAAGYETGCDARFMYWTWMSESGETDCTEALKRPGQNECRSRAGAEGPMQFMGAFHEAGISDPGWSIANLHDSVRAACRMWTKMNLWAHTGDQESFALRFSSEDVYRAGRVPQLWTDRAWNVGLDGYNQAKWIWSQVQSSTFP